MAKKHSSKTATEKAISSSEPRVMSYRGWKGVNFVDAPLTWKPLESGPSDYQETDLPDNYLMVQNNVVTTDNSGLETRRDSVQVGYYNKPYAKFTGVVHMYKEWIFAAVHKSDTNHDYIIYKRISDKADTWQEIKLMMYPTEGHVYYDITDITTYEGRLIVMASSHVTSDEHPGHIFVGRLEESGSNLRVYFDRFDNFARAYDVVSTYPYITGNPKTAPQALTYANFSPGGNLHISKKMETPTSGMTDEQVAKVADHRIEITYCYTNMFGSTLVAASTNSGFYVNVSPAKWSSAQYLYIEGTLPGSPVGITGVDLFARELENTNWVFIGHVKVAGRANEAWKFAWLGNMTDISQWTTSQLEIPTEDTSAGADAKYVSVHDSRLYYWGAKDRPYRLYIGGNPGSEFSIARGLGGAWIDIEPGSGYDIKGTAKWKTNSGANIVTILCGNENTNKVKRFNLVETNLTVTNEISSKGYMYEDVSNVVGCNSRYGFGVFLDGLYTLSRYGLMVTTMAMEYNNQMRSTSVSELISPVFTDRRGNVLRDGNLVCIDNMIYIALGDPSTYTGNDPVGLGNVILCYDTDLQAWYTFTHDQTLDKADLGADPDRIIRIFPVDSEKYEEGLGVITDNEIRLYPVTGVQKYAKPAFDVIIETGELIPRMPMQAHNYIQQLEFRFDYYIGDATVLVEGTDYYGRMFTIEKKLGKDARHPFDTGELRNHVEWIRIDKIVESLRVRIKGKARFRLTHINCKLYSQADVIGTPYGFDASDSYRSRHGGNTKIHHYIDSYNNLRRAVVT